MKEYLKFSLLSAMVLPVVSTCCSCSNSSNPTNQITQLIASNFNKEPIELGEVVSLDEAITGFKSQYQQNDNQYNEIVFACFNWIGAKNFSLNDEPITDENNSIIDYYNNKSCSIDTSINYRIDEITTTKTGLSFTFSFLSYITINFQKNIDGNDMPVAGDYITCTFSIQSSIGLFTSNIVSENNQYVQNITYSLNDNSLDKSFGLFDWSHTGKAQPLLAITDLNDINEANHDYLNGYYTIKTA